MLLQVIPAIDVLDGQVVRLMHGDYNRVTVYADDPVAQASEWTAQGASLVHVVDLDGARTGQPDRMLWERIAAAGIPFQVGGGIRDPATARDALDAGANRVVLGTAAVWSPHVLGAIGAQERVVAAMDVRDGRAVGGGWLDEGVALGAALDGLDAVGISQVLLTGIDRDGAMRGPDLGLLNRVVEDGRFKVIASGGVGDLDDLVGVADAGCESVIVGRALYERRFTLAQALGAVSGGGPAPA